MPILTYESDGFSVSPALLRQVDVHVQQVLAQQTASRNCVTWARDSPHKL